MTRHHLKLMMLAASTVLASAAPVPPGPAAAAPASTTRPDILVIVFDDVGFSDFGAFGSEISTPNIDALARGGLRYNRFDTRAICSATRASLLTGRNNQTVGMADLPSHSRVPDPSDHTQYKGELAYNAQMLPEALAQAGYDTYALGKWHLTPGYEGGPGGLNLSGGAKRSWPLQRGFAHFYGFLSGYTDQYRPKLVSDNTNIPAPKTPGYLLTTDLVDHAIADLDANAKEPSRKPAFVYLALGAAHTPIQVPRAYIDRYKGTYQVGWDAIRASRFARMKQMGIIPASTRLSERADDDAAWDSLDADHKRVYARFMATYAGVITQADEQVGRLIAYLKKTGRFDNTLIVLMSDNGAASEGGAKGGFRSGYGDKTSFQDILRHLDELGGPTTSALYQRPWAWASDTPMRRYKLWPYGGGLRDPLIVSWPSTIHEAGAIRTQPVDVIDLAPTLVDVAGTQFSATVRGVPQIPVAGTSVRASFTAANAAVGRDVQYFELRGNRAIRMGHWRAVAEHRPGTPFDDDSWHLYDTGADYSESTDVAALHPDILAQLKARWWVEARKYATPPLTDPRQLAAKRSPGSKVSGSSGGVE